MCSRSGQLRYKAETSRDLYRDNAERYERLEVEAFGNTIAPDREGSGARRTSSVRQLRFDDIGEVDEACTDQAPEHTQCQDHAAELLTQGL